jgi:uncharacterized protein
LAESVDAYKYKGNNYLLFTRLIFNFADFLTQKAVDYFRQFVIPFGGLKPGNHHFVFGIDDTFFKHFEYSEIKEGKITVDIDLEKEEKVLVFSFSFNGKVILPCDRCFEPMELAISGSDRLVVKFGTAYYEENEDLQIIPEGESNFDVSPFIYEYVNLLVPFRRVHPDDENGNSTCDPEILKKLDYLSEKHEPDHRWDALNDLLKKGRKE